MADEPIPTGQEPDGAAQDTAPQTFDADYVAKLRAEAAKYRNDAKAAKAQLNELQPLAEKAKLLEDANKSETEKLAQRVAEMHRELEAAQAAATKAAQAQRLTTLAAKAGVPADILPFLDVTRFDLDNEEETLAVLAKLKPTNQPTGGAASNPARTGESNGQITPAEWYQQRMGKSPSIFGGK